MDRPAFTTPAVDPSDRTSDRMRRTAFPTGRIAVVGLLVLAATAPLAWWQRSHEARAATVPFADSCARADALGSLVFVAFAAADDDTGAALDAALAQPAIAARLARCAVLHRVLPGDPEREALLERYDLASTPAAVLAGPRGAAIGTPSPSLDHDDLAMLLERSSGRPRAPVRRLAGHDD